MTNSTLRWLTLLALLFPCVGRAQEQSNRGEANGVRRVLIICGHPGDDAHHVAFADTIVRLCEGLTKNLEVAPEEIHLQFGAEPRPDDPLTVAQAHGRATREEIATSVETIRTELRPEDSLWVIVMGHAYFDGRNAHFNLPGPDLRADEFAMLFAPIKCREQVFFVTTAVSGLFIKPLAVPARIIVSATEADLEINETEFAAALADVLSNPPHRAAFDVDADGSLTLFDLYIVLVQRVIERYAATQSVVAEHALLDDNGDGKGSEVQIEYLTQEQGGRWRAGEPRRQPKKDGIFSKTIRIPIRVPANPPDGPADATTPENSSD